MGMINEASSVPTSEGVIEPAEKPASTNPDPITGAHGSHPFGTGMGAAAAGAAGAALAASAGPLGAVAAAAIGAVVGGLIGKGAGEIIFPTAEVEHFRTSHRRQPEFDPTLDYERDYAPAYRAGWVTQRRQPSASFEEAETEALGEWQATKGESRLEDEKARAALRAGWKRGSDTTPSA